MLCTFHNSDVKCTWHLKSVATRFFVEQVAPANNKENVNHSALLAFLKDSYRQHMDQIMKGQ